MKHSHKIPEDITASDLEKEAIRRKLIESARFVYMRRAARAHVVHCILNIDQEAIKDSGAVQKFDLFLSGLAQDEIKDRENLPTHGQINLAGPRGWYDDWDIKEVVPHPALLDIETKRRTGIAALSNIHKNWLVEMEVV